MAENDGTEQTPRIGRKRAAEVVQMPEAKGVPESDRPDGDPLAFIQRSQDVMTVRRVFGEPIERNGVTLIPVASVGGGGGGGGGEGPQAQGRGWGGGFGVGARPAGVYVIRPDGTVKWRPALDVNRAIFMCQLIAIVFLLTVRSVVKTLARKR